VSPYSFCRYDASYALKVGAAHRGRFGLITPVDPKDPAVEEVIAKWAKTQGTVAIRLLLLFERSEETSTTIVIDHLGLPQPFEPPVPAEPWAELPKVLELAAYENVRIKIQWCLHALA
jgi:L-fuconolactonase